MNQLYELFWNEDTSFYDDLEHKTDRFMAIFNERANGGVHITADVTNDDNPEV